MSNLIVNGYTGSAHVRSYDQQGLYRGIIGVGSCVLNTEDDPFEALTPTASGMYIGPGEGMIQGVHFRIEPNSQQAISFDAGAAGYNRIDLVVARYTMNVGTKVESVDLAVIKGTPTTGTPTVPAFNTCDIGIRQIAATSGVITCDFPLYAVRLSGTALQSVTKQFEVIESVDQIARLQTIHKYSMRRENLNGDGTSYEIRLARSGNVVFFTIGYIGTIPSSYVNKLYTLGNGLIPQGYRMAHSIGRATIPYFQVTSSSMSTSGKGQWMVDSSGNVVGYTNTASYIERMGSTSWITEDDYPA